MAAAASARRPDVLAPSAKRAAANLHGLGGPAHAASAASTTKGTYRPVIKSPEGLVPIKFWVSRVAARRVVSNCADEGKTVGCFRQFRPFADGWPISRIRGVPLCSRPPKTHPTAPAVADSISPFTRKLSVPASGRWRAPIDSCQTARSVEHVMAVSD